MRSAAMKVLLVAAVAVFVWASLSWPRLDRVETGRTPEYPDLQPREYAASPSEVTAAVSTAVQTLPGWAVVGGGKGPGGSQTHATARVLQVAAFDVFIHVRGQKGRTVVSVKSESRHGAWDFGQNARNIRTLLAALDRQIR